VHSVWWPLLLCLVHAQCPGSHDSCLYCMHSVLVATTPVSTPCTVFWQPPLLSLLHAQCSGSCHSCLYCMHSVLVAATPVCTACTVFWQPPLLSLLHAVFWQPPLLSLLHAQCSGSHHSCLYCMHSVLVTATPVSTACTVF